VTRLALYFNSQGEQRFTGREVAAILLASWFGYEQSKLPGNLPLPDATGFVEAPDAHLGALEGA
jgi:hypothetical protein